MAPIAADAGVVDALDGADPQVSRSGLTGFSPAPGRPFRAGRRRSPAWRRGWPPCVRRSTAGRRRLSAPWRRARGWPLRSRCTCPFRVSRAGARRCPPLRRLRSRRVWCGASRVRRGRCGYLRLPAGLGRGQGPALRFRRCTGLRLPGGAGGDSRECDGLNVVHGCVIFVCFWCSFLFPAACGARRSGVRSRGWGIRRIRRECGSRW